MLPGAVLLFLITASVGGIIESKTVDTFDRLTTDEPEPVKVTVTESRGGGARNLEIRAASSDGIPSVSSADSYIFPMSVEKMTSIPPEIDGPSCESWRAWAKGEGGVDAGWTYISLYIAATGPGPVILDRAQVELVSRDHPIRGVYALCPIQYLRILPRQLMINLDAARPTVEYLEEREYFEPSQRKPFRFSLGQEEVEQFVVVAQTSRHYVTWRLRFSYLFDGERNTVIISDKNGAPFRTSATTDSAQVGYSSTDGWSLSPPPRLETPKRQP